MNFAVGSIAMQLGSFLQETGVSPRKQVLLGALIYAPSIYLAQYQETLSMFMLVYAVVGGIGFGIIYFLPIDCAWSPFPPSKRPLITGLMLCCFSLNALATTLYTTSVINPENEPPTIAYKRGESLEMYYAPDSK